MEADKTNVYGFFCDFVDESRHPLWAELCVEFGTLQGHEIRGYWECLEHYSKVGNGTFWRNSECETSGVFITFLGEIGISQWSSYQMDEGKSMCLCWFRSMCWTDERHSRSNRKMERSNGRTQVVIVLPGCSGYRRRSNWIRVEKFPRIFIIVYSSRNPARLGEKGNPARGVQGHGTIFMSMFNDIEWKTKDENCISNGEESQELRNEILARSLDILGSRVGREVVWQFFSRSKKGSGIVTAENMVQRFRETGHLVFKKYQCLESWNLEAKERSNIHSLERRFDEHRTLVPNNSFCKSAQC